MEVGLGTGLGIGEGILRASSFPTPPASVPAQSCSFPFRFCPQPRAQGLIGLAVSQLSGWPPVRGLPHLRLRQCLEGPRQRGKDQRGQQRVQQRVRQLWLPPWLWTPRSAQAQVLADGAGVLGNNGGPGIKVEEGTRSCQPGSSLRD